MELSMEKRKNACGEDPALSPSAVLSGLYDRYGNDVLRLCCMFMKTRPDAEDAAQETFLKVWRKLDRYEGRKGCSVRSWIMHIACNTCRDLLRKNRRRRREQPFAMEELARLGNACSEDRELILDILGLPDKYRTAVLMVYWQKMTVREAAEALGTSRSTVCRRLEKARSLLEG